jgi:hypothetical protein
MKSPNTPAPADPRALLRKKLRDKISQKSMSRVTKAQKHAILDKSLTELGVDPVKFKDALDKVNLEGHLDALLKKQV